jgi:putative intracellular protease/amidase
MKALAILIALPAVGFSLWLWRLPAPANPEPPAVPAAEHARIIENLRPPRRSRPLVAIVALNDATETTDLLMPAGILRRADVADVRLVATEGGPIRLYPVLRITADATIADFDKAHPEGADYVIVPAMSRDDDTRVLEWLRTQSGKGAVIVAVCAGAKVVAAAGLLDGKRATTHWYYANGLRKRHPEVRFVPDRRIVTDDGVATTTGISASMPMMLTLIEAIAGRERAEAVASELGLASWDAAHASAAFRLTRPFATTALTNRGRFWRREELIATLEPGMDEVTLALMADAWSRTYRSAAVSVAAGPVVTANGITVLPDRSVAPAGVAPRLPVFPGEPPAVALDLTLDAIGQRYGPRTAGVVAMQLEYPRRDAKGG